MPSSLSIHTIASAPPGRRTRWSSGTARAVEPLERLRRDDGVERTVAERERLRNSCDDRDIGNDVMELPPQVRRRLHRDRAHARGSKDARRLPGPRAGVENAGAAPQPSLGDQPVDRLARVVATQALIIL